MIEKPPCFGSPCLAPASPCHECGVLAACTRRLTATSQFGLLMWPRLPSAPAAGPAGTPVPLLKDPARLASVAEALSRWGNLTYVRSRDVWQHGREDVLAVREASAARFAIEFFDVGPARISEMRSVALGVEVRPVYAGVSRAPTPTVGAITTARNLPTGSLVASVGPVPVTAVAIEVVRVVYHGSER